MFHIRLPRFLSLVISFSLLVGPLPLSAIAADLAVNLFQWEADVVDSNPDRSYVYLGAYLSNIAELLSQISEFDDHVDSPLQELKKHIESGFLFAEYDAVVEVLDYAQSIIRHISPQEKIVADLDAIIDQVANGALVVDAAHRSSRLRTLVINENIDVLGESTFHKHIKTKQGIHILGKLKVDKSAKFKKNVTIDGTLSVADLAVASCIDSLCVNNLSAVDESVSGTLSVNNAYIVNGTIENLIVTATELDSIVNNLTVNIALSANDAVINNATITNLSVTNCIGNLCVNTLSVVNQTVSGTLSVNDEIVTNATITNLSATNEFVTNLSATNATIGTLSVTNEIVTNATIGTLSVTNCIANLCVNNLSVVNESVSGTLSVANEIVANETITNLSVTNEIATNATIGTLSVTNCIANLCVNNLSVVNESISGALSVNDEIVNNYLRFQDAANTAYVGIQSPTVVPTSYTLSLPSTVPTANQYLQANAVIPTNLQWVTTGGSILPAQSEVIYVAQYGNDITGNGSFDAPYASLAKAISIANTLANVNYPVCIFVFPGIYIENNSAGPLIITANGVSIVGYSPEAVYIISSTPTNDFILANGTIRIANIAIESFAPLATGLSLTAGNLSTFDNVRFANFATGAICSGGTTQLYGFSDCVFVANGTALSVNDTRVESVGSSFFGTFSITSPAANTGVSITGAGANLVIDGGAVGKCNVGFNVTGNATITISATAFKLNTFDVIQTGASHMVLTGASFELTNGGSDIDIQVSGAGTIAEIIACQFNGNSVLGAPEGQSIIVSDNAYLNISSGSMKNYTTALQVGLSTDTSSTVVSASGFTIDNCTNDIMQEGSTTLNLNASIASSSKISINNPTNVNLAFFDLDSDNSLFIGSTADQDTSLLQAGITTTTNPQINYISSLYSTQAVGLSNPLADPTSWFIVSQENADLTAVTTNRADTAGLRLVSDEGSPVGGTTALRGWDITKNGSVAQLSFAYQNSDIIGQIAIPEYTVMQLDGFNNQLQLPTAGTQIVFDGDTNLYRSAANVLKTDDNFIVGTLTPDRAVVTAPVTNELASSVVTGTELSYVSGVTSSIQTQINGKVSKSGDIMTGRLQLPAGTAAAPSLTFTGSTTTGLSAATVNTLSFDTNGVEQMHINPTGVFIDSFNTAGVVHNNASGLLSSSLIVDADITTATITNDKLATISSADIPGDIVVRDGSGNFETNMITIDGTTTNPTDVATKAYVDSIAAMGITPKMPALVVSTTDIGSPPAGLQTIDGVTLATNNRVLLVGQTNPVENGLWLAQAGDWTRPADFATGTEAGPAYVLILEGAIYEGSSWLCSTPTAIIDTDPIEFSLFTLPNTTTGANIGAGTGLVFANKTGITLNFRTLLAGSHVNIVTNPSNVTFTTDATNLNTPSTIVARDASGNFSAGTITASLIGGASLDLPLAGGTLTGTLTMPAGTILAPSIQFTGSSTGTGISAPTADILSFDIMGTEQMNINSSGVNIDGILSVNDEVINGSLQIASLSTGVLHSDSSGNITSSLIVDADITAATITNDKLAAISSSNVPGDIVVRDASGNFSANIIIATLMGGATLDLPLAGGTMTGTLQLPAGTTAAPSLTFTGSTTAGLSANAGNLSLSTNALERVKISSGGIISIDGFTTAGVVHNDASGDLSSSLIVDADVSATAAIIDTKLATISTPGKVANSATTATSANTASTIVLRDPSGNFSANAVSFNDAVVQNLTLSNVISINDAIITNATIGTLSVTNCIANLCVNNLSVTNESVSGTLSVTNEIAANATITNLSATNEFVTNLSVTNGTIGTLSVNNEVVTGTLSVASEAINCNLTVGCNISINDSTSALIGNVIKNGTSFIHNFGTNNTFVGKSAGNFTTSGSGGNSAFGSSALTANGTGAFNTAMGSSALTANTIGVNNTAVGHNALLVNTTGTDNTAIGYLALQNNTDIQMTAIGSGALQNYVGGTGGQNVAIGFNALNANMSGNSNTAVGWGTLESDVTSTLGNNTAIGWGVLQTNTTGTSNTGVGNSVLSNSITGINNTAMGDSVLWQNITGSNNTGFGYFALAANLIANDNTAVGYHALNANITSFNTAVGSNALTANTTGTNNTAVGYQALAANIVGIHNTAMGYDALLVSTTGTDNTAVGYNALAANATGTSFNTAVGSSALATNTTGTNNAAVGYQALKANTIGVHNTAMGYNALLLSTNGTDNTAIGYNALATNATGINFNTAVGSSALTANITGANNTALGYNAMSGVTTGSTNIAIGSGAGGTLTTGAGNIYINANAGTAAESSTTRIGTSQTSTFIAGINGASTGAGTSLVGINASGQLGTSTITNGTITNGTITNLSSNDAFINFLSIVDETITGTSSINDAIITSATIANLSVTNCIADLCVNNLSVINESVSGTLSVTSEIVTNSTITNLSATNAFVTNLSVTNGTIGTLSVSNEVVTGTLSVASEAINCNLTVGCNISINDSTSALIGNVIKNGTSFIHNFGTNNTFVGKNAGNFTTSGSGGNSAFGSSALTANGTGAFNTAIGYQTLAANTVGVDNTALGYNALAVSTTGTDNTAIGYNALAANATGTSGNTAVGSSALAVNTTGVQNTAVGYQVLAANVTGTLNTAVGYQALVLNTGISNHAFGAFALANNTTGTQNTALGGQCLQSNTIGNFNTAAGQSALLHNTTGNSNTAVGNAALSVNITGNNNTAVGGNALQQNTIGVNNTAIGRSALTTNTTGTDNTAIGFNALTASAPGTSFNTAVGSSALAANTTGTNNAAIGYQALKANTVGVDNTALGYNALAVSTTGTDNTALGYNTFSAVTTGSTNIAIGSGAGGTLTTGTGNIYINANAGTAAEATTTRIGTSQTTCFIAGTITTSANINLTTDPSTTSAGIIQKNGASFIHNFGTNNTFVGKSAGSFILTGSNNSGFGASALASLQAGASNTAIGSNALNFLPNGNQNVAIGGNSLQLLQFGSSNNTAIGYNTLSSNVTGSNNIAIGSGAGGSLAGGAGNIYINANAGTSTEINTTRIGTSQTSVFIAGINGVNTGGTIVPVFVNTSGQLGTTFSVLTVPAGTAAAPSIQFTGSTNTGFSASTANTLSFDTSGVERMNISSSGVTIDGLSTAGVVHNSAAGLLSTSLIVNADITPATITNASLAAISSANVANDIVVRDGTGSFAAQVISMTDGVHSGNLILSTEPSTSTAGNIIKGSSRFIHDFGTNNTFMGINAGNFTTSGSGGNSAFGSSALTANGTGAFNTAVGSSALAANTTGIHNTALGYNALLVNTTGTDNTAVGYNTLNAVTTGSTNIAIGSGAGGTLTTGTGNIYIGANASAAAESNVTRIANIYSVTTGNITTLPVLVDSTGQLGTLASTRRVKHNIEDMNVESASIYQLRPVTFAYNSDASETKQYGLIAEEVAEVFPEIVVKDNEDQPLTVQYHVLPVLLLNEMKKQQVAIEEQQARLTEVEIQQQTTFASMSAAINSLQAQIKQFVQEINMLKNKA